MERVEREQGQDQREPDHVHKRHRHQDPHPRHRLAPSPRTTALTTMRITPNAAATPSSETRRLDMNSMEIGRLSYVESTMDVTKTPSAATNARLATAVSAGVRSGSDTRPNTPQRPQTRTEHGPAS